MRKRAFAIYVLILFGLCSLGCDGALQQGTDYCFPRVPPVCIVEDDPKVTVYDRKDLRPGPVDEMLVIPLYEYYQHNGTTDFLAIAHPFIYRQAEDIEKQVISLEQRDKLRILVFWVPGYFPDGLHHIFTWVPVINGKQMVVMELQRCLGSEQKEIDAAMKDLLQGDFVIGSQIKPQPPPPYTDQPRMTNERYDAARLVRSVRYAGRFFMCECPTNWHLLWAFNPGTRVVNRLTPEEKKTVAEFAAAAAAATEKKAQPSPADAKDSEETANTGPTE
jgi:hypothetical protein